MTRRALFWIGLTRLVGAEPNLLVAEGGQIHQFDGSHRWVRELVVHTEAKMRGICADLTTVYVTAGAEVIAVDLTTEEVRWRTHLEADPADRLDLSGDGKWLYVPSGFNQSNGSLFVLEAASGKTVRTLQQDIPRRAHNCLTDAASVYLAGRGSPLVSLLDPESGGLKRKIGPFSSFVRPFCLDSNRMYANVDGLLGFEVADLDSGRVLASIAAESAEFTHHAHHECPSHGIGLSPDGREVWVADSQGDRLLVFSATTPDYPLVATIDTGYDPGWLNFSLDGRWVYPSTGEVIDAQRKVRVGWLTTANGRLLTSEKILPIDWENGQVVRVGKQYSSAPSGS